MELILTVDENDNVTGEKEKSLCHAGKGLLHRAFIVMVFDKKKRLMLARRSMKKKLWPGFWDGTVAGHPRAHESYKKAAARRLDEELGIKAADIKYLYKFNYTAKYKNIGSENEVCAVLKASCDTINQELINKGEISGINFVETRYILKKKKITPWLKLILIAETRPNQILKGGEKQ